MNKNTGKKKERTCILTSTLPQRNVKTYQDKKVSPSDANDVCRDENRDDVVYFECLVHETV
jgi:hypothetical protein